MHIVAIAYFERLTYEIHQACLYRNFQLSNSCNVFLLAALALDGLYLYIKVSILLPWLLMNFLPFY